MVKGHIKVLLVLNLVEDIECLQQLQQRAMKLITGFKNMSLDRRLQKFGISTHKERRLKGDLIETDKIQTGKENIDKETFFILLTIDMSMT